MKKSMVVLGLTTAAAILATSAGAGPRTREARGRSDLCSRPNPPALCDRGATFRGIGFIEDPGPLPASSVWEMNPEGTQFLVSPSFRWTYFVKWTEQDGWGEHIGAVEAGLRLSPGGVIMGNQVFEGSFRWPGIWTGVQDEWIPIAADRDFAMCGDFGMTVYGMGGEGDYAAGLTWTGCSAARAFKWDKATNTSVNLGSMNGGSSRANAISDDGSTVYGWHHMLFGTRRATLWEDDKAEMLGDPDAREPKHCIDTGKPCTVDTANPVYGCPESYVDDASCQSIGACMEGVCLGGYNAGSTCTGWKDCSGTCSGGPNDGGRCNFDVDCPDTTVCDWNPLWTDDLFKGEVFDATPDGMYAVGTSFDYRQKYNSGYRYSKATGTFDEIPKLEYWQPRDRVYPFRISDDGRTAVGAVGEFQTGRIALWWREDLGTIDLQFFLVSQGLDQLLYWHLMQANAVSADGTIIGGFGWSPDEMMEGWLVDVSRVWVCHGPPGRPEYARTVGVDIDQAAEHVRHGDFLGTCEFLESNGLSRAREMLERRAQRAAEGFSPIESGDVYGVEALDPRLESVRGER